MIMDFLDPSRKKAHRRRLFLGYFLMAIMVAIGTLIVLYQANGWDVNRENGEFIQNGIVFVDSKPGGATVYVNNVAEREKTDTRLVLPEGIYTIRIEAEGYRTWQRSFELDGGQIERLVYPFLLPNTLTITDVKTYDAKPLIASQSPDRRWVLIQRPGETYQFDVFDLINPAEKPVQVAVPITTLTSPSVDASLEFVEWSTDNKHVLVKRSYENKSEYIIFNREASAETVNLNTAFGITPAEVSLRDKKPDQFYYLDSLPGVLRTANTKSKTISAPLLSAVIDYKSYGDNIILYVTKEGAQNDKTNFKILDGETDYLLKSVKQSEEYVLDVAKYNGDWYYVIGATNESAVFVYKNPVTVLKQENSSLSAYSILRLGNPKFVSFSANTQYIKAQSGKTITTLDLEHEKQYIFELDQDIPLDQDVKWMDGHRFVYVDNQQSYIVDFDGSNKQTLVTSALPNSPFFDRDYDNVFTIENSKTDNSKMAFTLTVIDNR